MIKITSKQIDELVDACDSELKTKHPIKFSFDKKWTDNFPKEAGVYAIFYKGKFFYVGETANLKERMKEVKRTYNHAFRRKLGKHLDPTAKVESGHFNGALEKELDEHYLKHLSFTYKEINFGRLEIEDRLMRNNHGLLNSIGKRSKITYGKAT